MNTLKFKLLAGALFAFAAAHAQVQTTAYSLAPTPAANAAAGYQARSTSFANDSYVLQNGASQYSNVQQTGPGNTADIVQDLDNDLEHSNNAYQTQTHVGAAGRNRAWIGQDGNFSTAIQTQTGGGNTANIDQGPSDYDFDYAMQTQVGNNNRAGILQDSNGDVAVQSQLGNSNYATTSQTVVNSWSTIAQSGNSHTAIVVQH